jgi:hypothetical protein
MTGSSSANAGSTSTWVVDQINSGVAAVEVDGKTVITVPLGILPRGVSEGDVLCVTTREVSRSGSEGRHWRKGQHHAVDALIRTAGNPFRSFVRGQLSLPEHPRALALRSLGPFRSVPGRDGVMV